MWLLLPPTIAYGVAHYVIANLSAQVSSHVMIFYKRFKEEKTGAVSRPGTDLAGDANREQVSKQTHQNNWHIIFNKMRNL